MRYRLLGKSGLRVSELCLGTMTFGEDWGWGSSKDESGSLRHARVVGRPGQYAGGAYDFYKRDMVGAIVSGGLRDSIVV